MDKVTILIENNHITGAFLSFGSKIRLKVFDYEVPKVNKDAVFKFQDEKQDNNKRPCYIYSLGNNNAKQTIIIGMNDNGKAIVPIFVPYGSILKIVNYDLDKFETPQFNNSEFQYDFKGKKCMVTRYYTYRWIKLGEGDPSLNEFPLEDALSVIKTIKKNQKKEKEMKEITIKVEGGCVNNVEAPNEAEVNVFDYDTEGIDEDDISEDRDGEECIVSTFNKGGKNIVDISVISGLATPEVIPEEIIVKVIDYDINGVCSDDITEDDDGEKCIITEYDHLSSER